MNWSIMSRLLPQATKVRGIREAGLSLSRTLWPVHSMARNGEHEKAGYPSEIYGRCRNQHADKPRAPGSRSSAVDSDQTALQTRGRGLRKREQIEGRRQSDLRCPGVQ